ncbi:MAG: hypothetical protein U1E03_03345 [Hyphomonadaceae bacterium]
MGGAKAFRTALLVGGALAATALANAPVFAQEATPASPAVDFSDPNTQLTEGAALDLRVRDDSTHRFNSLNAPASPTAEGPRRVELEVAAGGGESPIDISIAQRASLGGDDNGDLDHRGRGSELRVGRGLVGQRDENGADRNSTYVFVASDDEALTWQPGTRNEFGGRGASLSLQDRVEVGDMSAGVTWERSGVQTSLAYVEREQSTRVGNQSYTHAESFTGVTVTMRR